MKKMKNLRDLAIQNSARNLNTPKEEAAFSEFAKMAKFLDENLPPVSATPQTAPMPITTNQYIWHSCSAESMFI